MIWRLGDKEIWRIGDGYVDELGSFGRSVDNY